MHGVEGLSREGFTGWRGSRGRDTQDSQGGGAAAGGIHMSIRKFKIGRYDGGVIATREC